MSSVTPPGPDSSKRLSGDALERELREGWSELPTKTLFALAMGGLRVRMMRSLVTMLSIVLAIAFLAYTGLSNRMVAGLVAAQADMEAFEPAPQADVRASVSAALAADPVADASIAQVRELARFFGMDNVGAERLRLPQMRTALENRRRSYEDITAALERMTADPLATEAELIELRSRVDRTARRLADDEQAVEEAEQRVNLGDWVQSGDTANADMADAVREAVAARYAALIGAIVQPQRFANEHLRRQQQEGAVLRISQAYRMIDLAEESGLAGDHLELLRTALSQEELKRSAARLRSMLAYSGVSVERTQEGNPLDLWLIIMAMLTCAVGIANAMLMSVTERIREIGTMKCLGAQDNLVVKLFLLESGFLGIVGAAFGIVMGVVVAVFAAVLQYGMFGLVHFPGLAGLPVIMWSVVGGIVLSVVGAVYPAFAASRMRPVDALRVDE